MVATVAQARGKISETGLQIIRIDQELRSEVATELREIQAKVAELVEKRVAAEDQLKRIDILVTSSLTTRRFSGFPTALATFSVLRPVATTLWPAANATLAISRPSPRPAPVMNQTLILGSCSLRRSSASNSDGMASRG